MKIFYYIILLLLPCPIFSQSPLNWSWAKASGGSAYAQSSGIAADALGNIFVTGFFYNNIISFGTDTLYNAAYQNFFLVKYSNSGNVLWAKCATIADTAYIESWSVATDAGGNVYITGQYTGSQIDMGNSVFLPNIPFEQYNSFITKYDASGNALWAKAPKGYGGNTGYSIIVDTYGNSLSAGEFNANPVIFGADTLNPINNGAGGGSLYIVKYDSGGNVLWAKSANGQATAYAIAADENGNAYITGAFSLASVIFDTFSLYSNEYNGNNYFVTKYNSLGNVIWAKGSSGAGSCEGLGIATDRNNNIYTTGILEGTLNFGIGPPLSSQSAFIVKYNAWGTVIWDKASEGENGGGIEIATDSVNNVYATGSFPSGYVSFDSATLTAPDSNNGSVYIYTFDSIGNVICASCLPYGGGIDKYGFCVTKNSNGYLASDFAIGPIIVGPDTLQLSGMEGGNVRDAYVAKFMCPNCANSDTFSYQLTPSVLCPGDSAHISFGNYSRLSIAAGNNVVRWLDTLNAILKPDTTTIFTVSGYLPCGGFHSQSFTVPVVSSAVALTANKTTMCAGDSAQICAAQGFSSYNWSTGTTSTCIEAQNTGSYSVTVTNEGCTVHSNTLSITVDQPQVSISAAHDTLCYGDSTQICPNSNFASYSWNPAGDEAATRCIETANGGAYSLTVTDNTGCTAQSNSLNIIAGQAPSVSISALHDSICTGASTQICPNTNFASYTWSNNTHNQCTVATNPGFYSLTVTGTNGCTAQSNSVTIYPGHAPIVTISTAGDTICTNDSAQICPTSNFASYRWSDNATVQCLEAKNAGFYSLIATDNNGCTAQSNSLQITVLPALANLIITANIDTICSGDSANICATAGFSNYIWSNPTGGGGATGICINAGSTGNYYANAVSSAGCTAQSNQLTITVRPAPSVTISATADSICSNDSAQICAPQGFTIYTWNSNDTGTCIEVHNTGIYYVAVTGNHGCTAQSNSIQITAIPPVLVTIIASADTVCSGDSVNICATAGFSNYIWNNPAGGGATGVCIKTGNTGSYFVNATDNAGCAVQSNPVSITILPPATISISASADTICPGDSSNICAPSGFASYAWNPASGEVASNCIEAKSAGNYFVNATNNSGCVAQSNSVTITAVQPAPVNISANPDTICPGDSAHVCAPSGFTSYVWNPAGGGATSSCIAAKEAGDYYVTVTDNTGCTVESNHAAIATFQTQQLSISQDADTLIAYGATGVQWYLNDTLIPGATQNSYIAHNYGNYTVAVTDAEGCTSVSEPIRVTGIENISDDEYVSVYPNPLSPIAIGGKWQLSVGNKYIGAQVEILDADGRVVYKSEIKNIHSEIEAPLAGGVYLLRVVTVTGGVVRKLIKLL